MKKDTEILADWAENFTPKSNFKIDDSIYTNCLMIDFAKYYQKQVKNYDSLDSVSQQRELLISFFSFLDDKQTKNGMPSLDWESIDEFIKANL